MDKLYLEVYSDPTLIIEAPVETLVILFAYKFSKTQEISIFLHKVPIRAPSVSLNLNGLNYEMCTQLPFAATLCQLPVVIMNRDSTCIAGICAVVRQIFKTEDPGHGLLGFKQGCLNACAETSVWTRFCEVDAIKTVKMVLEEGNGSPQDLVRFEMHLSLPVRAHNINHLRRQAGGGEDLSHTFAEGHLASIADVILFAYFYLTMKTLGRVNFKSLVPLVTKWEEAMLQMEETQSAMTIFAQIPMNMCQNIEIDSSIPQQSLYKTDPRRYKPRQKIFTKQEDILESLHRVSSVELDMIEKEPYGNEVFFDWESVPWSARPAGGALPLRRQERKSQQLEGMARAVLKLARNGDTVVDFCAGSGHLGLILAHFLPRCSIILLENKEESMRRARQRAAELRLNNIFFCQTNVDYFKKEFTVGVSLHACGVATDLVMETCIRRNAVFVCCPCCYGSMQSNHMVNYPRSELMGQFFYSEREYLVLGHAADQVHIMKTLKTAQGMKCMDLVDGDRCFHARERGYSVKLTKLYPLSCTTKNNLLIGVPFGRAQSI